MPTIHMFPFQKIKQNSSLLLYGNGLVGKSYIDQILAINYCKILCCLDREKAGQIYRGIEVLLPEQLPDYSDSFDYIVIALDYHNYSAAEVKSYILSSGIDERKIIFEDTLANISGIAFEGDGQLYGCYSYAQHGDDLMVINIFTLLGISNPTYLDIGAHHPWNISNTALLYQRGSRGINIEANPDLIMAFFKERPEDKNICCGIAGASGTLPFYIVFNDPGQNGFSKELIEAHHLKIIDIVNLPVKTLKEIIESYANGVFPDYLTIDVEGLEYEILASYDLKSNGPKVISVELNDIKVKDLLYTMDYFPYCSTGGNLIFVKEEYRSKLYCAWPSWHNGSK